MLNDRRLRIGLIATGVGAACCFTPLAVATLGALGLMAYAFLIDVIALPLLALGLVLVIASLVRILQNKA